MNKETNIEHSSAEVLKTGSRRSGGETSQRATFQSKQGSTVAFSISADVERNKKGVWVKLEQKGI